jgi:hypothetical protein
LLETVKRKRWIGMHRDGQVNNTALDNNETGCQDAYLTILTLENSRHLYKDYIYFITPYQATFLQVDLINFLLSPEAEFSN